MKAIIGVLVLFFASTTYGKLQCSLVTPDLPNDWIDMASSCVDAMRAQIQKEIGASFEYLSMASYFSRDVVNRPGFAEHFFKAAGEEREHAQHLIEYLSMRGKLVDDVTNLITIPTVLKHNWKDGVEALTDALNLEAKVTKSIRKVIVECEKGTETKTETITNDYHLVDYLTGVYLEEQYKGQRELAGKLSTLKKMMKNHGQIGEFMFDKTLLE